MKIKQWVNGMGWDIWDNRNDWEVWRLPNGHYCARKFLRKSTVPFLVGHGKTVPEAILFANKVV